MKRVFPLIILILLTAGCFEEQRNYDSNIKGAWIGIFLPDSGGSIGAQLFVSPDNRCYLVISDPTVYTSERLGGYGEFKIKDGYLTASIKIYDKNGKPVGEMSIINGRIETTNGEREFVSKYNSDVEYLGNGEISLSISDSYKMYSSLEKISGTWEFYTKGVETTISISKDDGSINGLDTTGCVFNGSISRIDSKYNLYDINSYTISNCSEDKNGIYRGLASLMDENHLLVILVKTDESYGFIMHLGRQQ